jgi:hypothetical protein
VLRLRIAGLFREVVAQLIFQPDKGSAVIPPAGDLSADELFRLGRVIALRRSEFLPETIFPFPLLPIHAI